MVVVVAVLVVVVGGYTQSPGLRRLPEEGQHVLPRTQEGVGVRGARRDATEKRTMDPF